MKRFLMARSWIALATLLSILATTRVARATDPDPWFGQDKALHFGVSAAIASGTYAVMSTQCKARYPPLLIGGGLALAIGGAKEGLDSIGFGDPSWKDFTWDVIGTVVGLGIAWGLDLAINGVGPQAPLFATPAP